MPKPIKAKVYIKESEKTCFVVHPELQALSAEDARKWKEQVVKDFKVKSIEIVDKEPNAGDWDASALEIFHTPASLKEHIEAENASSFELLVRQLRSPMGVVPFVGAGLSIPFGFDSWERVLKDAAQFHSAPDLVNEKVAQSDFLGAAGLLQKESADRFQATIAYKFGRDIPREQTQSEAVGMLPILATGPVITTNFDHVIETTFIEAGDPFDTIITGPQPDSVIAAMHRNEHALIKIHGDARDRSARVFTAEEYDQQYSVSQPSHATVAKLLHILFTNRPLLFLGSSLDKDKTLEVLARIHSDFPGLAHYGVLAAPYRERRLSERRLELASYGILPIWYLPGDFGRLRILLEELIQEASTRLIWKPAQNTTAVQSTPKIAEESWPQTELTDASAADAVTRFADRIVRGKLAFLLGAGIYEDPRLTARSFYGALAKDYGGDPLAREDIVQYVIDTENRKATWEIAKGIFAIPGLTPAPTIRLLASIPKMLRDHNPAYPSTQWILTTNWDTQCEGAFEAAGEPFHVLYYQADGAYTGLFYHRDPNGCVRLIERPDKVRTLQTGSVIVKLDGGLASSPHFTESAAMSPMDYSASASRYPEAIPQAILSALSERGLLCLGSGLHPPNVQRLVRWAASSSRNQTWAALRGAEPEFVRHWKAAGVDIIDCDYKDFIPALRRRLIELLEPVGKSRVSSQS